MNNNLRVSNNEHEAKQTLVIDTSYGLTVGLHCGPIVTSQDSQRHVELLQPSIEKILKESGLKPNDIDEVIVGIGPAPFTGLRTGIVAAKAFAFATGANLLGQDILGAQASWSYNRCGEPKFVGNPQTEDPRRLTLVVNDARRRQLYYQLFEQYLDNFGQKQIRSCLDMDIDYPDNIVERVNRVCKQLYELNSDHEFVVDVVGRGVDKYVENWTKLNNKGKVEEDSIFDHGLEGLECFIQCAHNNPANNTTVEPLYLRRPDISKPNPNKRVVKA